MPPFRTRLKRGLSRAFREYRSGLQREGISRWEHLRLWLTLAAFLLAVFGIAASVIATLWFELASRFIPI